MKSFIFISYIVTLNILTSLCQNIEDLGVEKCYKCPNEECEGPLIEQICAEELHNLTGFPVKALCFTFQITNEDGTITDSRGCGHDDGTLDTTCIAMISVPNVQCSVCRDNLCNMRAEDKGAKKCYYCNETCQDPIEEQDCYEVLGPVQASCYSAKTTDGLINKKCVQPTVSTNVACRVINNNGGNCTICDTDYCNGIHVEDDNEISTSTTTTELISTSTITTTTNNTTESITTSTLPVTTTDSSNGTTPVTESNTTPDSGAKNICSTSSLIVIFIYVFLLD